MVHQNSDHLRHLVCLRSEVRRGTVRRTENQVPSFVVEYSTTLTSGSVLSWSERILGYPSGVEVVGERTLQRCVEKPVSGQCRVRVLHLDPPRGPSPYLPYSGEQVGFSDQCHPCRRPRQVETGRGSISPSLRGVPRRSGLLTRRRQEGSGSVRSTIHDGPPAPPSVV